MGLRGASDGAAVGARTHDIQLGKAQGLKALRLPERPKSRAFAASPNRPHPCISVGTPGQPRALFRCRCVDNACKCLLLGKRPCASHLVYATTMDVRGQVTLQVPASFHYAFGGLPDWSYLVVAGTDADNDGSIWDEGEPLSGIYPSIEAPVGNMKSYRTPWCD